MAHMVSGKYNTSQPVNNLTHLGAFLGIFHLGLKLSVEKHLGLELESLFTPDSTCFIL